MAFRSIVRVAAVACLAVSVLAGPASAAVVYGGVTFTPALGFVPGATTFDTATSANLIAGYTQAGSNMTFKVKSGTALILNPATSGGNGAEPYQDHTPYLSVLGGGAVTVTLSAPASHLSFYWGSIDAYNTITFSDGSSFTGTDIVPKSATGCQQNLACNGVVSFNDIGGTFTSFTLTSRSNSFEADNFTTAVPEPSTWAMMVLGFLGLGVTASRRRSATPVSAA